MRPRKTACPVINKRKNNDRASMEVKAQTAQTYNPSQPAYKHSLDLHAGRALPIQPESLLVLDIFTKSTTIGAPKLHVAAVVRHRA